MGDVSLSVKLLFGVHPAFNLLHLKSCNDGRNTGQKIVLLFFAFDAFVEYRLNRLDSGHQSLLCAQGHLVTHENAYGIKLLPLSVQAQKRPYFEIAGRNVKAMGEFRPIVEVAPDLPVLIAVIDDEEIATLW